MDPATLAKDFVFKALDKIDFYWHFFTVGLLAFAGWLATGKTLATRHIKCLLLGGYFCFAAMNLRALDQTYAFAEVAVKDLSRYVKTTELPGIAEYTRGKFGFGQQRVAAYCIHVLMAGVFGYAIVKLKGSPEPPKD